MVGTIAMIQKKFSKLEGGGWAASEGGTRTWFVGSNMIARERSDHIRYTCDPQTQIDCGSEEATRHWRGRSYAVAVRAHAPPPAQRVATAKCICQTEKYQHLIRTAPAPHPHGTMELTDTEPSGNFTNFMEVYQTELDDSNIDDDNFSKLHASIFGGSFQSIRIVKN